MKTSPILSHGYVATEKTAAAQNSLEVLSLRLLYRHLIDSAVADAVRTYSPEGEPTELSRNAMEWIAERGIRLEPSISFDYCCQALGIDAETERSRRFEEIWTARLELQGPNRQAMVRRLRCYGVQTRQQRHSLASLPRVAPAGERLRG